MRRGLSAAAIRRMSALVSQYSSPLMRASVRSVSPSAIGGPSVSLFTSPDAGEFMHLEAQAPARVRQAPSDRPFAVLSQTRPVHRLNESMRKWQPLQFAHIQF